MKSFKPLVKLSSMLALTVGVSLALSASTAATAFADSAASGIQPNASSIQGALITIPEPPQPGDPVPNLPYYVLASFNAESTPRSTISFGAEGITDVQFTAFPFPGQNKQIVVFSLEAETEHGWESVYVATFQPSSKVQKQAMKLPRNDYKKFRIFISSNNPNYAVLGYKQWSS
ncbi:hypothetical protein [Paenibacillus hunanensis]|uniref:Secreted protein n=1 Tax=Paenibacillus hunanensis TaxID=539262 RepID=A0ABU1IY58_9BACL|nr:hypothetical protein [Paenibacillus hunanensis]MDR6244195.1 hypothetical protein [Paenibacillus hunanensis]GGJ18708.1 hypothetical protein GCM10008022_29920 [Paenibacillus hunanensis]